VTYKHSDNIAPYRIEAIVDPDTTATAHTLKPVGTAPFDFTKGVVFKSDPVQLPAGMHSFRFEAQDRFQTVQLPKAPDKYDGPKVNFPPTLSNVEVTVNGDTTVHTVGPDNALTPALTANTTKTLTFKVTYKDIDQTNPNVPESDHYVKLEIDGMSAITMKAQGNDYPNGVVYQAQVAGLTAGAKLFRIEAFDGPGAMGDTVTLPSTGFISGIGIWSVPELLPPSPNTPATNAGTCTPLSGIRSSIYQFRIIYKDADGRAPQSIKLVLDPGAAGERSIDLTPQGTAPINYVTGVTYGYDTTANELAVGSHTYRFDATDSLTPVQTTTYNGPTVANATLSLAAPTTGSLSPQVGPPSTTFTYQVVYTNADNNAPEKVQVVIDGTAYDMTRATTSTDYRVGVLYEYKFRFSRDEQKRSHVYYFQAKDIVNPDTVRYPATGNLTGPQLNTAFFVVTGIAQPPSAVGGPIVVGGTVTITGRLDTNTAVGAQTIPVQLVRPDGSGVNESVVTASDGTFTYTSSTVLDQTGDWKAKFSWNGVSGTYDATSLEAPFTVTGVSVSLTSGVLDLVALPIVPVTPDASTTFNPLRADGTATPVSVLDLITWAPTMPPSGKYVSLNRDSNFPGAKGGAGYWTYPSESVKLSPKGKLWNQTQAYSISVAAGWNLIGSVFTSDISWGAVQVRYQGNVMSLSAAGSVLRPYAWGYDPTSGSYKLIQTNGVLKTGRGYWVRALEPCEIILNPPGTKAAEMSRDADITINSLQVVARVADRMDTDNFLPLTAGASRALVEKPPYMGNYASIQQISTDEVASAVPTRAGQQVVAFEAVTNVANADITITFPNLATLGRRYEASLVDLSTKTTRALGSTATYTYNSGDNAATRRFAVIVTPVTANSRLVISNLQSTGRAAGTLAFSYTLSNSAAVKAQIVSSSGTTIRNLAQGRAAAAGANALMWDGRDNRGVSVPSGTYLLKLTATDTNGRSATAILPVTVVR
jgi:flagellar basal-body rod modification protein FlgD